MSSRNSQIKFLNMVMAISICSCVSLAEEVNFVSWDLKERGWEEVLFEGKTPNKFSGCGKGCIKIDTNLSVSMIGRKIDIDLQATPILTWEWRVEKPVTVTDLTIKGKDDRAAALYVTFPYDPKKASLSEKLLRPMVELKRGENAPGRVISYVWAGYGAPDEVIDSPFFGSAGAIIIRRNQSEKIGEWVDERVDVASDYRRIFGMPPNRANYIFVAGDSDDTHTSNQALLRNIQFSRRKK